MKQLFITLIISPIIFFLSCKREINDQSISKENTKYTNSEIVSVFSTLGKLHNDGLDSVYNDLEKNIVLLNKMSNTSEKRELLYGIVNQSIHKFIEGNLHVTNINIDETLLNVFKESNNLFGKDLVTQIKQSQSADNYSQTYLGLINKIDGLININAQEQAYKNLISDNIITLTDDFEKMQFVSSVSIAYNSTSYWKKNIGKWNFLLNPLFVEKHVMTADAGPTTDPNKTGTDIGKADVSGIIYGAGSGCVYGAIGGTATLPGIGTITGCLGAGAVGALTGGLGNSAKKAVDSLVDWLLK